MWNMFRRSKILLLSLLLVTFIFAMIAITPVGFPYRPKTNVGRVNFLVSLQNSSKIFKKLKYFF